MEWNVGATLAVAHHENQILYVDGCVRRAPARGAPTWAILNQIPVVVQWFVVVLDFYSSGPATPAELVAKCLVFFITHVADAIGKSGYVVTPKMPTPLAPHHEFKDSPKDEKHQKGFEQEKGYQPQAHEQ